MTRKITIGTVGIVILLSGLFMFALLTTDPTSFGVIGPTPYFDIGQHKNITKTPLSKEEIKLLLGLAGVIITAIFFSIAIATVANTQNQSKK